MRKIKKVMALLLSMVMVVGMSVGAFGLKSSIIPEDIVQLAKGLLEVSISDPAFNLDRNDEYVLNNKIPTYTVENEQVKLMNNAEFYPVYANGKIIGMFTVNDCNSSDPTYSFGREYADVLNDTTNNGKDEYFLISIENKLFVYTNKNLHLLTEYTFESSKNQEMMRSLDITSNIQPEDIVEQAIKDYSGNLSYTDDKDNVPLNIRKRVKRSAYSNYLNVKKYNQGKTNLCWAATVWCIGQYKTKDNSYTPEDVAASQGLTKDDEGNAEYAEAALIDCYGLDSVWSGALSQRQIEREIDNDDPIYTLWKSKSAGLAHAVCLRGYGYSSLGNQYDKYISVMDSQFGTFKTITQKNNKYTMSYYTTNYDWIGTLTV